MGSERRQTGGAVAEKARPTVKRLQPWKVVLHNDDYTTMDFVIEVLEDIFLKSPAEAYRVMINVHTRGHGICGAYPWEVAETKVAAVHDRARERGFPLRASLEED